jgi:REP element-mobilizing transposase RayT
MVKYRRYQVPGGTYFFTVALQDRKRSPDEMLLISAGVKI